jgi:DNA polymerase
MIESKTRDAAEVREILRFYAEAGVDAALCDEPVDRFAQSRDEAAAEAAADRPDPRPNRPVPGAWPAA